MPVVLAAVSAYSTYAAAAEFAAFTLELGATGTALFASAAAATAFVVGSGLLNKKPPSVGTQERKQTIRSPAAARRLIYGQVRAGGVLVYAATSGGTTYANMVVAVGEGEIEGFDPAFWMSDTISTDTKFAGLVDSYFHTGEFDQAADAALIGERPGEWTADHRLLGVAYAYVRLKADPNAFSSGLPQLSFLVKGRKVFDPRRGLRVYSTNPALCILDYLRADPRVGEYFSVGMAATDDLIDFTSFGAAANICDELVPSIDPANTVDGAPGFVRRYTLNGIVDLSSSPAAIIEEMQGSCAGRLVFTQGKYRFYAGAFDNPVGTIDSNMLRADPSIRTKPSRADLFNIVRGQYVEPRQDWSETDYAPQTNAAAVLSDGAEIVQDVRLSFTTNAAIAQRLAALALAKIRGAVTITLQCNWSALRFRLWSVVTVNIPEINVNGLPFRIVEYTFADGGGIDLVLQYESAAFYAWSTDRESLVQDVVTPAFSDAPPAEVTLLSVSGAPRSEAFGVLPQLSATWSYSPTPFFKWYLVEFKLTSEPDWTNSNSVTVSSNTFVTNTGIAFGDVYDVRVQVVNLDGRHSEFVEVDGTVIENDTTAPGIPTALSVTGTGTHTVRWTTPDNEDFKKSNVYQNTVNTTAGASMFASITGLSLTAYTATNTPGGARYYFVSSVDRTGNESALTYAGTGT